MIGITDVQYSQSDAVVALVVISDWTAEKPLAEYSVQISDIAEYQPGEFYKRELPCLLKVLDVCQQPLQTIVVDGYVWLGVERSAGLGAHLHEAIDEAQCVVGVAKTKFHQSKAVEILRGDSRQPLCVTAAGTDAITAASNVVAMHGPFRIPTMLRRVDQLARGIAVPKINDGQSD